MTNINDVCDFTIFRLVESGVSLNNLKLQKLLYYHQAWSWAIREKELFDGKFEAWVHGPVNRTIVDRFSDTKSLYSVVDKSDIRPEFDETKIDNESKLHVLSVLEAYGDFADTQLEDMTHREEPWIEARGGIPPNERCETEICEATMKRYYGKRVATGG